MRSPYFLLGFVNNHPNTRNGAVRDLLYPQIYCGRPPKRSERVYIIIVGAKGGLCVFFVIIKKDRVGVGRGRGSWKEYGDTAAGARTRRATHCID